MATDSILPPVSSIEDLLKNAADRTAEFEAISRQQPARSPAEDREFVANRLRLMRGHPSLDKDNRKADVDAFERALGAAAGTELKAKGDAGMGVYFNDYQWQIGWANGTAARFAYICPTRPGPDIKTIYLTSCNRAGKCVEALVSYRGSEEGHFEVYDWARPDTARWQTNLPFSKLGDYLFPSTRHGRSFQCLSLMNFTARVQGMIWRNDIFLFSFRRAVYEKIYTYTYSATDSDQKSTALHWGPMIEIFQPSLRNLQPMGVLDTEFTRQNADNSWDSYQPLNAKQSYLTSPTAGLRSLFVDPNFSWAADAPA
jgi:hypothetical protein